MTGMGQFDGVAVAFTKGHVQVHSDDGKPVAGYPGDGSIACGEESLGPWGTCCAQCLTATGEVGLAVGDGPVRIGDVVVPAGFLRAISPVWMDPDAVIELVADPPDGPLRWTAAGRGTPARHRVLAAAAWEAPDGSCWLLHRPQPALAECGQAEPRIRDPLPEPTACFRCEEHAAAAGARMAAAIPTRRRATVATAGQRVRELLDAELVGVVRLTAEDHPDGHTLTVLRPSADGQTVMAAPTEDPRPMVDQRGRVMPSPMGGPSAAAHEAWRAAHPSCLLYTSPSPRDS